MYDHALPEAKYTEKLNPQNFFSRSRGCVINVRAAQAKHGDAHCMIDVFSLVSRKKMHVFVAWISNVGIGGKIYIQTIEAKSSL